MSNESILVVDDEPDIRNLVKEILEDEGYRVDVAEDADSARAVRERVEPDLVLLDIWMPKEDGVSLLKEWKQHNRLQCPVVMMSGHGTVETAVEATRLGAFDFVEKPLSLAKLLLTVEQALTVGERDAAVKGVVSTQELIGTSRAMTTLREQAQRIAAHNTPLLISGEAGSGKHALARYIHACSDNARGQFVELVTDAAKGRKPRSSAGGDVDSLIARAHGGTLYVAGVTVLAEAAQRKLLQIAKQKPQPGNLRLIVATRENPEVSVQNGSLPEELYHAIKALQLHVLPLREHCEDVSALLEFFVNYFTQHEGLSYRHFNVAAQNRLRNYTWPGNVDELRNLVQRSMVLGGEVEVGLQEVEQSLQQSDSRETAPGHMPLPLPLDLPLRQAREVFERAYLEQQLKAVHGNISELAKRTGVERTHLYRKMRSLGISPKKKRNQ